MLPWRQHLMAKGLQLSPLAEAWTGLRTPGFDLALPVLVWTFWVWSSRWKPLHCTLAYSIDSFALPFVTTETLSSYFTLVLGTYSCVLQHCRLCVCEKGRWWHHGSVMLFRLIQVGNWALEQFVPPFHQAVFFCLFIPSVGFEGTLGCLYLLMRKTIVAVNICVQVFGK